jgi:hypothetical protein
MTNRKRRGMPVVLVLICASIVAAAMIVWVAA